MKYQLRLPFYLAWQYIHRGKKWAIALTLVLLATAFVNLLFISSLFNGVIDGSNKQIINTMSGNIYITSKNGKDFIGNTKQAVKQIKQIEGVEGVSAETQVQGRLKYSGITVSGQILAVNPEASKTVVNIADKIVEGAYLKPNDTNKIIIGCQIAGGEGVANNAFSFKGAKVGEEVQLMTDKGVKTFVIKGIFDTKFINSDLRAFITEKSYKTINPNYNPDSSTTIIIKTNQKYNQDELVDKIKALDIDGEVYTWQEAAGLMKSVSESFLSINVIVSFVGIVIAAVTVFIVIYVDILNKRRQIGILRAIGIRSYIIVLSYVILSSVYALGGVLLGTVVFHFGLVPYFQAHPFEIPITDVVLVIGAKDYIARAESLIWVSIFSGLIPSIIVVRAKMLDAILGK
ncbi:ABC transporter permease [Candidatus Saccharibacteria bacterium]|jgi:putative ABC transport system permease protein|nr:ABC transporter permease [Candidatus Saccharibacteria bacterium]